LNLNGFTVNPYGELIFCCDTIYRGAVLGSLKKHSLKELMKKAKDVAKRLKKIREMHIKQNRFFEGFDSCEFCNYYLKDMIKK